MGLWVGQSRSLQHCVCFIWRLFDSRPNDFVGSLAFGVCALLCIILVSLFTICGGACSFHASVLRPASQAGPMQESAGDGEVS